MREAINIPMPQTLPKEVKQTVKSGGFGSFGGLFFRLRRWWEEEKLVRAVRASERELKAGKGRVLRSLADFDDEIR